MKGGLAFLKVRNEDQALEMTRRTIRYLNTGSADSTCTGFLDGHLWPIEDRVVNGHAWRARTTVVQAWLTRGERCPACTSLSYCNHAEYKQLYGPVDPMTGSILPVPVPRSLVLVHDQGLSQKAIPVTQHRRGSSLQSKNMTQAVPRLSTTRDYPKQHPANPTNLNAWTNGPGHHHRHSPQHSMASYKAVQAPHVLGLGQISPRISDTARTLRMSISSRGSSTSHMPLTPTSSTFSGASSTCYTPPRSAKGSISSTSTSSSTLRGVSQLSQSDDDFASLDVEPRPRPTESFKVSMSNLKPDTTKKEVNDLLEQKIKKYLQYSEMKLVESRGQSSAEITFKNKEIASHVVHKLDGIRFKERTVQVRSVGS